MFGKTVVSTSATTSQVWWKKVWSLPIPFKVKHFVWRAYNDCIPTHLNLHNRHVPTDGMCRICQKHVESTDHALFRCRRAKRFWRQLDSHVKIRAYNHLSIQDRFMEIHESDKKERLDWICVGAWAI